MDLTHFNEEGRARMVDVSAKAETVRTAVAECRILMQADTLARIQAGNMPKGDVLAVAQVAGILAAKRTFESIPMCHPICLTGADIRFTYEPDGIRIRSTVRCKGETGVEMEALHACSAAALTIYDMCKAVQKDMEITDLHLLEKAGGKSGLYRREVRI
ncbi:MAG: cyclic pyranopterin monophosphate synthase MoaC [Clostridia bacterium]|nr:cyclic pyranopterin monophosphate synthase MoaC [Clostridia bacterium]